MGQTGLQIILKDVRIKKVNLQQNGNVDLIIEVKQEDIDIRKLVLFRGMWADKTLFNINFDIDKSEL